MYMKIVQLKNKIKHHLDDIEDKEMQIKSIKKLMIAPLLSLAMSTPSIAGNDSVALVYLNAAQQSQAYKVETIIYRGKFALTVIVSSRSAFANIAANHSEIYIASAQYTGWIKKLELVGNVIHGFTSEGYHVAISTVY